MLHLLLIQKKGSIINVKYLVDNEVNSSWYSLFGVPRELPFVKKSSIGGKQYLDYL
jgi:hypothetical protein